VSSPGNTGGLLAALALLAPVPAIAGVTVETPAVTAAQPVLPVPSAPTPPVGRSGGVAASAPRLTPMRPQAAEPQATVAGLYQIRCWQHGRLLFEDRITLPADAAAYGIRMSGTDRNGKPMYVAETRNATCLVRIAADERYWPQ